MIAITTKAIPSAVGTTPSDDPNRQPKTTYPTSPAIPASTPMYTAIPDCELRPGTVRTPFFYWLTDLSLPYSMGTRPPI